MSSQIICRECNTPNAPGSKFCNNCGARLPLSTNLICPNCGIPNPRNRVFCDSCGTRLVREETPKAPSKAEEPSAGGTKAFSLPARPPGDTGELDPNTLPDWLKTGDTSTIGDAEAEDDQADELPQWLKASLKEKGADPDKLPRLEELTPEKRTTDDLPDWLVNESDTSPIIDSPKEISTEIYLDLVSRAEDSSHEDDPFDANEASLPDWLAEAASFPDITPATSAEPDETSASDSSAESDFVSDSEPAAKSDEGSRTGLTDWLTDPDALAESTPAADAAVHSSLADWLTDQDELV
ncbi:MAG TPA: zinc ribbon domain-containing protein, partial [Anaerolineae bacterium]